MRILFVALSLVLATVGSSAAETAEEIVAWYNGYAQLWRDANNVDFDAMAGYFAAPRYNVGADGVAQLVATKEMNRARLVAGIENMKQRSGGWSRSEGRATKAQMLNPGVALIETEWTSYTTDGKIVPIGGCQVGLFTYLAAKTKEGWKVLSSHTGPCQAP
jgi:hypothetical protein